ncbi:unnamed protein product [Soboliphyme baturini]|uniref:Transposase n=1 Tax=Soboliphyme baturini TaxID=241478 RepID=A0A183IMG3_9BILA|nr:unnamed protein product [Soboliphyme baturini]
MKQTCGQDGPPESQATGMRRPSFCGLNVHLRSMVEDLKAVLMKAIYFLYRILMKPQSERVRRLFTKRERSKYQMLLRQRRKQNRRCMRSFIEFTALCQKASAAVAIGNAFLKNFDITAAVAAIHGRIAPAPCFSYVTLRHS